MEQGDVFQKPIKLDLAVGMVLTLFGIGTLAEFSKCLKVSGVHCIQYLLKGWEWAVATLCSQGCMYNLLKNAVLYFEKLRICF